MKETSAHQDALSPDPDPKPISNADPNPDPDPNPDCNCNPDIAPAPDPKLLLSLSYYKVDIDCVYCPVGNGRTWSSHWQPLRSPLLGSHCHLHLELGRGEGSDLLCSPSPTWQVLGAAGPASSCCVRRCGHYFWESVNPKSLHIKPRNHETWVPLVRAGSPKRSWVLLWARHGAFLILLLQSSHPSVVLQG